MFSPYGWDQTAVAPHHWRFDAVALAPFTHLNTGLVLIGPLNIVSGPEYKIYTWVSSESFIFKRHYRCRIYTPADGDVGIPGYNINIEIDCFDFWGNTHAGNLRLNSAYPIQAFQIPIFPADVGIPNAFPLNYWTMTPVNYKVPFTPGGGPV
jgi:hypothetical protein